jgi:hypothetical protein
MPEVTLAKTIGWLALYLVLGVLVPLCMARRWMRKNGHNVPVALKDLFGNGELGLFSLALTIPVIWDFQRSGFAPQTAAMGSVLLGVTGIMASAVWVESYCRDLTGTRNDRQRTWRDSRNLAFFIFCMAAVGELLLHRLAKVLFV